MTTPQAQGDFEGSIMSYSSSISISAQHASDLWGIIRLAPSLWRAALSFSWIYCSTKLQQPISALCFEKMAAIRFKTAFSNSNATFPILPLKCSISGRTSSLDSNSYDDVRSGKFEHLDESSSVSDLIEKILFKDFSSLFFLETWSLFAWVGQFFTRHFFRVGVSS